MPAAQAPGSPASSRPAGPPAPAVRPQKAADLLGVHKEPAVALSLQDRGGEPTLGARYGTPLLSLSLSTDLSSK
jgi:hypothetical protein